MAIGTYAGFVIYNDEFHAGVMERVDQIVDVFNAKSAGAITLVSQASRGHFQRESFFKNIASVVSRRDIASAAAFTDLSMTADEEVRVKLNRKFGPVAQTLDAWRKLGMDASEMSYLLGFKMGEEKAKDMLNSTLRCAKGAIGVATAAAGAGLKLDASALTGADGPNLTHRNLASMLALMGDFAANVRCFVMHSKPFFDLLKSSFNNAAGTGINLTQVVAGIAIMEGTVETFGRPVIVTDSPDLIDTVPTPDVHLTYGLVENALLCFESEEQEVASAIVTGLENLVMRIQGEWAFDVGVKGYKFTTAQINPADATLITNTNWTKVASSDKLTAGPVLLTAV